MTAYAYPTVDATAVVGRRIGAWVIDLVIYLLLSFLLSFAFTNNANRQYDLTGSGRTGTEFCNTWRLTHDGFCIPLDSGSERHVYTFESSAYPFVVIFGHMALYALVQGLLGGSIGKLMVGLRVVDSNGDLCGVWRSFVRTFLWIIDAITLMLPIVGGILMVTTKGHRRLGDMAAGTFVVDKSQVGRPVYVPGLTGTAPQPGLSPGYPGSSGYPGGPGHPGGSGHPDQPGAPSPWGQQPAGTTTAVATDGPHWDVARDTYIQWDVNSAAWLEWDDALKAWKPIST